MGHRVLILLAALASVAHAGGRVTGKVSVTDVDGKQATAEVIVYVVGFDEPGVPDPVAAQITQKDRKFVPELVAITKGESVSFPNGDNFLHNVFSESAARKFDLGSFKYGDAKSKEFPTTGVVDVYCNIHPNMAATILVLPNHRHARAAADGSFHIDGVPPGRWTVFAYTRRAARPVSTKVTVVEGQDSTVSLSLTRGAEPEHRNKFGEKYRDAGATYH